MAGPSAAPAAVTDGIKVSWLTYASLITSSPERLASRRPAQSIDGRIRHSNDPSDKAAISGIANSAGTRPLLASCRLEAATLDCLGRFLREADQPPEITASGMR
jgi:hypothetical protein